MLAIMKNKVMDYAWGSKDFIPSLLGVKADGKPWAELWLGAHPKAPSELVTDTGLTSLADFLAANKARLPFLLKVLSAEEPLSIQAHPSKRQAEEGWSKENRRGLGMNDPSRNYRDDNHKPEMFIALTDFTAMIGFRDKDEARKNILAAAPMALSKHIMLLDSSYKEFFVSLLELPADEKERAIAEALSSGSEQIKLMRDLARHYPADIGVLAPLFLNTVRLSPGEGMYVPAGTLHSYIKGSIIEIMSESDNVLRGGLTPKHVDQKELARILLFQPLNPGIIRPTDFPGGKSYACDAKEFRIDIIESPCKVRSKGPEILLILDGNAKIEGARDHRELSKGESVFVTDEESLNLEGKFKLVRAYVPHMP
jgi:mannose-6-phosphate isomerase